jgi:hypothetical protein
MKKYKVTLRGTETLTFSRTAHAVPVIVSANSEEEAVQKAQTDIEWEENTEDRDTDLNNIRSVFAVDDSEYDVEEVDVKSAGI